MTIFLTLYFKYPKITARIRQGSFVWFSSIFNKINSNQTLTSDSQICDRWSGVDCSTWRWSWSSPVAATTTIIIIIAPLFQCHHLLLVTIHVMQLTVLVCLLRLEVATSLNYLGNSCSPVPTPPSALFMFISPKTLPKMSISDPNNFTQF